MRLSVFPDDPDYDADLVWRVKEVRVNGIARSGCVWADEEKRIIYCYDPEQRCDARGKIKLVEYRGDVAIVFEEKKS